ncbi:DUF6624 domain-containing protein [Flammeovirga sp. SJP92]|uniref:DUF6624 domain-containing protein n=1 Tax=Flammeovirga sp. SJP92 TaxID=1775430 RepID=UPI000788920A|nr:DUF6624 domain-containing protein [Flammeovirga sp. SJP92]KXX71582.1 hypothetical protein AVL50_04735 [Flammeovirga sp. SJP92]
MFKNLLTTLFLSIAFYSCINQDPYGIQGLQKLSLQEAFEITVKNAGKEHKRIIYRYHNGKVAPLDTIRQYSPLKWGYDYYANMNNEIQVVILRKPTKEDTLFQRKLAFAIEQKKRPKIELVDIDCHAIDKMLARILFMNQENKASDRIDEEIDFENLTKVVSILEKCGMPTVEEVGKNGVNTLWLIIQHADPLYRSKYYPLFVKAVERGDLQPGKIAVMEDRMHQDSGEPQEYGSQIIYNENTGQMEVYTLQDPKNVNKRRARVGLEPMEVYVKQFGIDY